MIQPLNINNILAQQTILQQQSIAQMVVKQSAGSKEETIDTVPFSPIIVERTEVTDGSSSSSRTVMNSTKTNKTSNNDPSKTFSACLLVKDDNDILNEWIAYHYHTLNLRYMIVATDPASQTSPSELFQTWRDVFGMVIDEWQDADYMPDYFLQGHYDQVPSFMPTFVTANASASIWHMPGHNLTNEQLQEDLLHINNHRFRQVTFVSRCFQKFAKQKQHHWVAHIDTDEYMVINPRLRARPNATKKVHFPTVPTSGSILQFMNDMFKHYAKRLSRICFMMPTVLFGSIEDTMMNNTIPSSSGGGWNRSRFESLRWKYHANWTDIGNGLQKAIVNVSKLDPTSHAIFKVGRIVSVHQPLYHPECRKMTLKPDVNAVRLFPLTLNHYVGSLERYLSRADKRRNVDIYTKKAHVKGGIDDGWIQGWLASFVEEHGIEKVTKVLGDYLLV
jgi:hypothetical protein